MCLSTAARARQRRGGTTALQAEPLLRAGAHSVLIDFINVDQAKGDLFPMYEQVPARWPGFGQAKSFGGDRDRSMCRRILRLAPFRVCADAWLAGGRAAAGLIKGACC